MMAFLGCSDDNENDNNLSNIEENFKIESYYASYANYTTAVFPDVYSDNLVKFKYDNDGKLIKRIGDILYFSPNSAYGPVISDSLYTDLVYFDNNKVKLSKGMSYLGYMTTPNESIITFDSNNRMVKKANKYNNIFLDTITFIYDNDKLTSYVKTSNQSTEDFDVRSYEESTLYYNINKNVDSIVSVSYLKYSDTPYKLFQNRKTKIFKNYDNSFNPFKKLNIFEETFYRSLSKNNYKFYSEKSEIYTYPDSDYYEDPIIHPATVQKVLNWNLSYDSNGNWMYNQP